MPIVENGLLAYYNSKQGFDQVAKKWNNISSSTTGLYNGTINGNITLTADGSYFTNTGGVAHVEINNMPLSSLSRLTIEFYTNVVTNSDIFYFGTNQRFFSVNIDGKSIRIFYNYYGSTLTETLTLPTPITTNNGSYFALAIDSDKTSIYQNGVKLLDGAVGVTFSGIISDNIRIGSFESLYTPIGVIDNLRIYNRVLSTSEILENYAVKRELGVNAGTPKTATFKTKQIISKSNNTQYKTKQTIFKSGDNQLKSKQIILKTSETSVKSKQIIFKAVVMNLKSKQVISKQSNIEFDLKQILYKNDQISKSVKLNIYKASQYDLQTQLVIYQVRTKDVNTKQEMFIRSDVNANLKIIIHKIEVNYIDYPIKQVIFNDSIKLVKFKNVIYKAGKKEMLINANIFTSENSELSTKQVIYKYGNNYTNEINLDFFIKRKVEVEDFIKMKIDFETTIKKSLEFDAFI